MQWLRDNGYASDTRIPFEGALKGLNHQDSKKAPVKQQVSTRENPITLNLSSAPASKKPATFTYTNEHGEPLYRIIKSYDDQGQRQFKQQRFDNDSGQWLNGLKYQDGSLAVTKTLYNLTGLTQNTSEPVYIVEGEKDVESLKSLGYVAVTSGGAKSWQSHFADYLVGREIVVIPDHDQAGTEYADAVIASLHGKAKSIKRVELAKHWQDMPAKADITDAIEAGMTLQQFDVIVKQTPFFESLSDIAQQVEQAIIKVKPVVTFTRASDAMANANKPIPWLIDGFIIQDTLCALVGKPSSGKSLIALSMAASVATGTDWHGHKAQKGAVFYLAGEGQWGVSRRLKAWERHNQVSLDNAPLYLSNHAVMLDDAKSVLELIDIISASGEQPSLIVIDTVQRSFSGDENSASDMSKFIAGCDLLRQSFPQCVILLAHHSGHSENRARGSSAFHASLDTSYMVNDDGSVKRMVQNKTKDGKPAAPIGFEVVEVNIFDDEQSITIKPTGNELAKQAKRLTATMRLGLETFATVAIRHKADLETWRKAYYPKSTRDTPESKRAAFQQVRAKLVSEGIMSVVDDVYTLNQKSDYPEVTGIMVTANFSKAQDELPNSANEGLYEQEA
jgi:5S rRNA maturation endonuclease (ribonuclease M5)